MAGHGPPPKPAPQRRRRNKAPEPRRLPTGASDAPNLPAGHLPATERWYETWATSPQASQFTATDWQRLHMLAFLVDRFFDTPTKELMAEVRLNESLLGATQADRLRLHWEVAEDAPKKAPRTSDRWKGLGVVDGGSA